MSTLQNKYDAIENIIFDEGISIKKLEIQIDVDKMLIFLNTNHILAIPISLYKTLQNARPQDLQNFQLIANGTGVHWPSLDEDLSLKGFLKDALRLLVLPNQPQLFVA